MTVGRVGAGTVMKLQAKSLAKALPAKSVAAVVIVAVNKVLVARRAAGVKVAMLPVQLLFQLRRRAWACDVKVVSGEVRVAQFIASLKVALTAWLMATPVAAFAGMVETTVGVSGAVAVVKVHT